MALQCVGCGDLRGQDAPFKILLSRKSLLGYGQRHMEGILCFFKKGRKSQDMFGRSVGGLVRWKEGGASVGPC